MSLLQIIEESIDKLPQILSDYEKELEHVEERIAIQGRTLERANVEQSSWQYFYDTRKRELGILVKYFSMRVEKVRSSLYRSYTENYNRELGDRAIDKYINNEEAYLHMQQLYLEVNELYEKYDAVVEAFHSRGFALRNITEARVSSVYSDII